MPSPRISCELVAQIEHLNDAGKTTKEIAQELNLKRLQVAAIIAHRQITAEARLQPDVFEPAASMMAALEEPTEAIPAADQGAGAEQSVLDAEAENGVYVGDDAEYEDPLFWVPWNTQLAQNPHLMIVGESGSGKTYATQCLVAELAQAGIPSVIFDYGQGFETDTLDRHFRTFTEPQEYLIGENGLAINPVEIFPRDVKGPNSVATRISDVFDAVYRLGDIQRKVLIDAIVNLFEHRNIRVSDPSSWDAPPPTLGDLQQELEHLAGDKQYPAHKNAQTVSARLTTFFMLNSFQTDGTPWAWNKLINDTQHRVHILQFRGLEGRTQKVVIELLLWHLFFYLKSEGQHPLRLYCVLDEAHHLSFRDSGPVDSLLREARKFGLGLIFASQQPGDFSAAAYANSASKLVFQTADPDLKVSKFLAAKCSNYEGPDHVHEAIASLPQGEAFFITANRGRTVKISDFSKRSTLWKHHD
jgi:DNA phosphorothioation-dependent restriction protein DptH